MSEGVRLRVTSDGTPRGTRVITEDGKLVKGVQMVSWQLMIDGFARVQVELAGVAADLVGLVDVEDSSFLEDPMVVVEMAVPQEPPEGPGFTERTDTIPPEEIRNAALNTVASAEEISNETLRSYTHVCPICGDLYRDPDQVCAGGEDKGEHVPAKVVEKEAPREPEVP